MLIDEPGSDLHAKAQEDILRILESAKDQLQILFTTHSPYLLNVDKIYRVLAAERNEVSGGKTVTNVYKFPHYGSASSDTLFPLYTKMGVDISHQQVIKKNNNIILEEISAYYYLKAFWKLFSNKKPVNFLPATGCSNIPTLANLLLGWGISFIVILDDDSHGRKVFNVLRDNRVLPESKLIKITSCDGIEDIFDKSDFVKYVTNDITEVISNDKKISRYIKDKKYSKPLMARDFYLKVENSELLKSDLSADTIEGIKRLLDKITLAL